LLQNQLFTKKKYLIFSIYVFLFTTLVIFSRILNTYLGIVSYNIEVLCISLFIILFSFIFSVIFSVNLSERFQFGKIENSRIPVIIFFSCLGFFTFLYVLIPIIRLYKLHSGFGDLGYFDNILWNTIHGRFMWFYQGFNYFSNHFCPVLILILPLYKLFQRPELFLIIQGAGLAVAAIPLFLLARRELKSSLAALTLSLAWFLYSFVYRINYYDFHPIAFAPLLIFSIIYFYRQRRDILYWLFIFLLLTLKESTVFLVITIGTFVFIEGNRKTGLQTIFSGIIWGAVVMFVVMPNLAGDVGALWIGRYKITEEMFNIAELGYLVQIILLLLPLGFLPLFNIKKTWIMLPPLLIQFLSSFSAQYTLSFHYSSSVIPFVFLSGLWGYKSIIEKNNNRNLKSYFLCILILTNSILCHYFFTQSFNNRYHRQSRKFLSLTLNKHDYIMTVHEKIFHILKYFVPEDASLSVQNNLGVFFAKRNDIETNLNLCNKDFCFVDSASYDGEMGKTYGAIIKSISSKSKAYRILVNIDGFMLLSTNEKWKDSLLKFSNLTFKGEKKILHKYILCDIYYNTHQYKKVIKVSKEIQSKQPHFMTADLYFRSGVALFNLGHYEEAIEKFKKVLMLRPDNKLAKYNLSVAYQEKNR